MSNMIAMSRKSKNEIGYANPTGLPSARTFAWNVLRRTRASLGHLRSSAGRTSAPVRFTSALAMRLLAPVFPYATSGVNNAFQQP